MRKIIQANYCHVSHHVRIGHIHSFHVTLPPRWHPVPAFCTNRPHRNIFPILKKRKKLNNIRKILKNKALFRLKKKERKKRKEKKGEKAMGGEIAAETMTRKKKKKGRPSLLELQKRSLKQQQQQQHQQSPQQKTPNFVNPNSSTNSNRRSTRRNPSLDGGSSAPESISGGDDDDDERLQKKHKLLLGLNSSRNHLHYPIPSGPNSASYGSDSNADGEDPEASLKRRKLTTLRSGSDQMV